jgi:L-lactate utilization protein LutB
MLKKKNKKIPFHIAHNYKEFELKDGTKFWAKDESDANMYIKHVDG